MFSDAFILILYELLLSALTSGIYVCKHCGHQLFSSVTKYEHESPWPAFTDPLLPDSLVKKEERPKLLKVAYFISFFIL